MGKNKSLRILINSNAPWSTSGYGSQMYDLVPKFRDLGHEIGVVCFYGLEGGEIMLDGIRMFPKIADVFGLDAMVAHQKKFKPDITMTLQDIWTLDPKGLNLLKRWIPFVPIDHEPTPPAISQRLRLAYRIISMSKFGENQLHNEGLHTTHIPHSVNMDIFKPLDKNKFRKKLGIPNDVWLFGMVSANKDNPPRKSFQEVLDAFKMFLQKHPKSAIYFHTLTDQQGGFNIGEYSKFIGIEKFVYKPEPYNMMFNTPKTTLAQIYNTFDTLLCPSTNEGFGVPIIEAQACGVPAIVNDFTSMPELINNGKSGLKCKVLHKRFTPMLAYTAIPDPKSIYDCMEEILNWNKEQTIDECVKKASEYELNKIINENWKPYFEKVYDEIQPKT